MSEKKLLRVTVKYILDDGTTYDISDFGVCEDGEAESGAAARIAGEIDDDVYIAPDLRVTSKLVSWTGIS